MKDENGEKMMFTTEEIENIRDEIDLIQEQIDDHKLDLRTLESEKRRYESILKSAIVGDK